MKVKEIALKIKDSLINRPKEPELPTGIDSLDDICWGLHRREVTVIAGRPSHGKSMVATQIAWHLATKKNKKVTIFSLEMTKESLVERIVVMNCEIDSELILKGKTTENDKIKITEFIEEIPDGLSLEIEDGMGFTFGQIEAYIKSCKPDVIFVDYIQIIAQNPKQTERETYSEYTRQVKLFAKKYNIAIVLVSQANRESEQTKDKMPKLSTLKGTGTLEENPDMVLILYYPYKDDFTKKTYDYKILVAKNRNGRTGLVTVSITPEYYKITS